MIYTLDKEQYSKVNKLLIHPYEKQEIVLNAVVDNVNRGVIYVDDLEHPKTAIVYAVGLGYFLIGDANNEHFNRQLHNFIFTQLKDDSFSLCGGTWFCSRLFTEAWQYTLEKVLNGRQYYLDDTVYFKLNNSRFNNMLIEYTYQLDSDFHIVAISKELIRHDDDLRLELLEYWPSEEAFMQKGLGFAILRDRKVVSTCYSCCVYGNRHEIYVATYDEHARNRGLATVVCQYYIRACLEKGYELIWSTDENNDSSKRVADKLGFDYTYKVKSFEFEF